MKKDIGTYVNYIYSLNVSQVCITDESAVKNDWVNDRSQAKFVMFSQEPI